MERSNRIQQLYGYMVCLIAVITFLIASSALVNAVFDRMRPAGIQPFGPDGGSFEAYKRQQVAQAVAAQDKGRASEIPIPSDSELHRSYDTQQRNQESYAEWQATKSIVTSCIMLLTAALLFVFHWRWVRRTSASET